MPKHNCKYNYGQFKRDAAGVYFITDGCATKIGHTGSLGSRLSVMHSQTARFRSRYKYGEDLTLVAFIEIEDEENRTRAEEALHMAALRAGIMPVYYGSEWFTGVMSADSAFALNRLAFNG